jgi:hypothetical protein
MSSEAGEDEEDWNHLPESERAMAKLNKRRGQNKLAQRAFRARTRVQNAKVSLFSDVSYFFCHYLQR